MKSALFVVVLLSTLGVSQPPPPPGGGGGGGGAGQTVSGEASASGCSPSSGKAIDFSIWT